MADPTNGGLGLTTAELREVGIATATHLELVVESVLLATLIGIPLGILATRSRWAERIVLTVANVLQTIPSLALLGFLLIAFGGAIGKPPALAALVLYALLPVIKNTVLGLRSLDSSISEAADGLGMTRGQKLRLVELPLAVPFVLGGLRIATVAAVGMATIAATIGARGLGTFIFRGVANSSARLILMGSIPAAILALVCDTTLGAVEHWIDPNREPPSRARRVITTAAILLLLGVAAIGAGMDLLATVGAGGRSVVIGSKDGTEMILLGHMLSDLVESHTDLAVDRRFNLGGTLVCYNALRNGGLDVYVEYTGTALTSILKEPPENDPERVRKRVASALAARDRIIALAPFGFENTFAIVMRREQAERLGIRTISDAARQARSLRAGFGPEFMNRPDGYPGLVKAYALAFNEPPREMDRNLLYQAVAQKTLDLAACDSTDGRIAALDLVVLQDDRRYFPPYEAIPLVHGPTLERHPELRPVLDQLAGRLDAATMRRLNYEVDGHGRDPGSVAREYLQSQGLLRKP